MRQEQAERRWGGGLDIQPCWTAGDSRVMAGVRAAWGLHTIQYNVPIGALQVMDLECVCVCVWGMLLLACPVSRCVKDETKLVQRRSKQFTTSTDLFSEALVKLAVSSMKISKRLPIYIYL